MITININFQISIHKLCNTKTWKLAYKRIKKKHYVKSEVVNDAKNMFTILICRYKFTT